MKLFVIQRHDDITGDCPVIETARLTQVEADDYCADQELMHQQSGNDFLTWSVVEIDMPLTPQSPRIMAGVSGG